MEDMYLFIPVITILGGFSIAILTILTDHKQKMLLIEKGLVAEKRPFPGLRSGLTFTFLGLICLLIFWEWISIGNIMPWYAPGGIFLALGLAQLIYYSLIRRDSPRVKKPYSERAL